MQNPEAAAQELRRCVSDLHFCGALVNDHTNGHYLDEPQFSPLWEALEELDVPLYIHPGAPSLDKWNVLRGFSELKGATWEWQAQVGGHALRIVYSGLFDRHPKDKVILGNMGEFLPFQLSRLDSRYQTLKDQKRRRMPSAYLGHNIFITTSGVFSPEALAGAVMAIGEDEILFAIDYPYESSGDAAQFLKGAPLSESARETIASRNAERLLHIS